MIEENSGEGGKETRKPAMNKAMDEDRKRKEDEGGRGRKGKKGEEGKKEISG